MKAIVCILAFSVCSAAQEPGSVDGRPVIMISNDRLSFAVRTEGGAIVRLVLRDDSSQTSALHSRLGHFVCVDGFGPVSPEEHAAGLPMHGEAHRVPWELVTSEKKNRTTTVAFSAKLPIVNEIFRRTIHMIDGENVIYVESELENLLGFDRPVNWGEHPTIGAPFLELGKTVVEMSATRAMTRSHGSQTEKLPHRLSDSQEFTWPMAPGRDGESIDMRQTPGITPSGDHTTSLMDPGRRLVFVTAFHPEKRLLLGYVFRREEYPWTQLWEFYPDGEKLARGLEFAAQPFDLPRREMIQMNSMFGAPTYRWLPAKSKIHSAFVIFYTRTPEGFRKVDNVVLEDGALRVEDRSSGLKVTLAASRGL